MKAPRDHPLVWHQLPDQGISTSLISFSPWTLGGGDDFVGRRVCGLGPRSGAWATETPASPCSY